MEVTGKVLLNAEEQTLAGLCRLRTLGCDGQIS
jgi:hypothetical protein